MDNVSGYKIKVVTQSYLHFLAELGEADLILTPTRRLATKLNKDYAQLQKNNVWQTDIISITGWIERLWQEYQDDIENPLLFRLNTWQNQLIWQRIVESSEQTPLLRKESAVALAQQAWSLLKEWNIPWQTMGEESSQDIQTFLSWCAQYEAQCHHEHFCDDASIFQYLSTVLIHKKIGKIYLSGFTDIKPAVKILLDILKQNGTVIEILEHRVNNAQVFCSAQIDAKNEWVQAALWAQSQLKKNPNAPIGVIIPDLALRFNEVDQIFSAILKPQSRLANHYHEPKLYNISSGNKLTDFPIISIVFELLNFSPEKMATTSLSKILLSPFIAGAETEKMQRAQMDFEIKKLAQEYVSLRHCERSGALSLRALRGNPGFDVQLGIKPGLLRSARNDKAAPAMTKESPSTWAIKFKEYLHAWGWPGERVLNSIEYQVVKRFYELLTDFAALDIVQGPLSYFEACKLLRSQAKSLLFQGESENAPLQILGALEGEGLYFHALWICGLHHENWPQACAPHPFLPIDLQREKQMPHASNEREYIFAAHLTQRYTQQAHEVVLSYPQQDNDKVLMPSALIKNYPHLDIQRPVPQLHDSTLILESWQDTWVALSHPEYISGGVGLLQSQSQCPFQAFARYRLKTKSVDPVQTGLTYAQRGDLVHAALDVFWKKIKTSQRLLVLSESEYNLSIDEAIDFALQKVDASILSSMHKKLEQQRLKNLLNEWLTQEKIRPDFTVVDTEKNIQIELSQIKLKARIDRVDQLSTGEILLIDYKTGDVNKPDWLDTRPQQVQLPLYAISHANTQGVAFAKVKSNQNQWIELWAHQTQDEFNLSWDEVLGHWQKALTALADEFYHGYAQVAPLYGDLTCRYCDLELLCRIRSAQ